PAGSSNGPWNTRRDASCSADRSGATRGSSSPWRMRMHGSSRRTSCDGMRPDSTRPMRIRRKSAIMRTSRNTSRRNAPGARRTWRWTSTVAMGWHGTCTSNGRCGRRGCTRSPRSRTISSSRTSRTTPSACRGRTEQRGRTMRRRSQLYVPANNPRMIANAAAIEADSILFDFEDAVPPNEKESARRSLGSALRKADWGHRELGVRINAPGTPDGERDLGALGSEHLGYVGKQVVHPNQVRLANEVFTPTEDETRWAKEVVAAYEAAARAGRGAVRVRDRLVDAVHYRGAKKTLERAGL